MTTPIRRVSVIVVAFGDEARLDECLAPLAGAVHVVVIDNASRSECRDLCAQHGVDYVDPGRNGGFAAGVNIGVQASPPDSDVLLLNPDARMTPADLEVLVSELAHRPDNVCAVAPSQENPSTGAAQRVAWPFPSPGRQWLITFGLGRLVKQPDFLIGAALLIRRKALTEVGPLDESYFLYCEETDWQRRATLLGWRVDLVPVVRVQHIGGATSADPSAQQAYFHAGNELYIRKWFGARGWHSYRAAVLVGTSLRCLVLRGERRQAALARLRIYCVGPVQHRAPYLESAQPS